MKLTSSAIMTLLLASLGLTGSGCGVAGYASKVIGAPPTPAQYLPANKPLVVIVKDLPDPTGMRIESEEISADIEQEITTNKVAPLIPGDRVLELRTSRPAEYSGMSPARIGRAVGADQVLYVEMLSNTRESEAASDMLRGRISASVKIIDANSGALLWPDDGSGGSIVNYQTPLKRLTDNTNAFSIERSLYAGFANKVVKLFRSYKTDE